MLTAPQARTFLFENVLSFYYQKNVWWHNLAILRFPLYGKYPDCCKNKMLTVYSQRNIRNVTKFLSM